MKSLALLSLILLSTTLCSTKKNMNTNGNVEEFMQKVGDSSMNWLEIHYRKDSVNGIFYGFENCSNGEPVYYRSEMEGLVVTDTSIEFMLSKYLFSDVPFEDEKVLKEMVLKDESQLPSLLKFPQHFIGTKTPHYLNLKRTSIMYDSRFDEFTLTKVDR